MSRGGKTARRQSAVEADRRMALLPGDFRVTLRAEVKRVGSTAMNRTDLDLGYVLSFFSVAAAVALLPAACSEAKDSKGESHGQVGGDASSGGADGEDAGGAGGSSDEPEQAGAATGGANEAGSGAVGTAGMGPSCEEPTSECGETCVDLSTSVEHCGACDHACAGSDACIEGECKARAWGTSLTNTGSDRFNPIVQLAEDGTAFVVAQSFSQRAVLTAAKLAGHSPILSAQDIDSLEHDDSISEFRFAMNPKGQGVVAFITSAAPRKLYASYFDGEKFNTALRIDDSGLGLGYSSNIDVGFSLTMEDDGAANVVYRRFQEGTAGAEDLYWVRTPGFGEAWDAPAPIENLADSVTEHQVASNGKGGLLASWAQGNHILVSQLANGAWSAPTPISDDAQMASQPRAALNANGKAVVVFLQQKSQENGVYGASYDGDSWSSAKLVAGSDHEEKYPAVALRADGSGLFSYEVRGGAGENDRVFTIPFENASELSPAKELTSTPIVSQAPRAFVGPGRSAGVFWSNTDNLYPTKVALTDGTDFAEWAIPSGLHQSVIPSIDYNDSGDGIVVWHDSSTNLGYRRYQVWP